MEWFVHLHVHSYFSFLDGASSIEALLERAAALGMSALAITDHDTLSGAVRFVQHARSRGIKPIIGAELTLEGGFHLTLLAQNRTGYANLCRILTDAHLSAPRRHPRARWETIARHAQGLIALTGCRKGEIASRLRRDLADEAKQVIERYRAVFGDRLFVELQDLRLPKSRSLVQRLAQLAEAAGVPVVATNNVHYTRKADFPVHDVLTCVRTLTRLESVHPERPLNAEQYLKSPQQMAELLAEWPEALANTARIAKSCDDNVLPLGEKLFPAYPGLPPGHTSAQLLRQLVYDGARARYGRITEAIRSRLEHELAIIEALGVEDYFLVAHDIVQFARGRGIRTAGRGSAADSAVAYTLFLTDVDAIGRGLLFERFLSMERAQKPDIDIDFDARRRDEVAAYVYDRFGHDRVASVATYNTFQARSALREIGKALGYPAPELDALAKRFPHMPADAIRQAAAHLPELRESDLLRPLPGTSGHRYELLFELAEAVAGFPRYLGTHLGGLIISDRPIVELVPLQIAAKGVVVAQYDKEDVEAMGFIKLDLLSLRTLSAVDDTVRFIQAGQGRTGKGDDRAMGEGRGSDGHFSYDDIPLDDRETYRMLNRGETVGIFQLESPAQRALQSRLGAEQIEDIVASVALIRPGPIKGNMVEPFIARRQGLETITYVHPALERILKETYGVVLFQEQVIEIATAVAGFTPGEADRLRRAMTHFRSQKEMKAIGELFVARARERGVSPEAAHTIFSYIVGYAGYGFCEAHAAAFATTAYKTAYLLRHHPAEFYAALLNNQPMGFYPAHTVCAEARRRGIRILPVDINRSAERFTIENGAIRVGLLRVRGMNEQLAARIVVSRGRPGYASVGDFCGRVPVARDLLENLVLCGAFDVICPNRRALLWEIPKALGRSGRKRDGSSDRDDAALLLEEPVVTGRGGPLGAGGGVPDFSEFERFKHEFYVLGLHPTRHPMEFFRNRLTQRGVLTTAGAKQKDRGTSVRVAGLVVRPHRPPTRSGKTVVFFSLEDETGLIDVTVFEDIYRRCGGVMFTSPVVIVEGRLERRGNMPSITAFTVRGGP
ncbi:MAG: DNA polymerase III subunit alpha [Bacillota bacterium]